MNRLLATSFGILALATCGAHCNARCPPASPTPEPVTQQEVTAVARVLVRAPRMDGGEYRVFPTRRLVAYTGPSDKLRARPPCAATAALTAPAADGGILLVAAAATTVRPHGDDDLLLVPVCGDDASPWSATITYLARESKWTNDPIHGQCIAANTGVAAMSIDELR
jgi:hypothetical protein